MKHKCKPWYHTATQRLPNTGVCMPDSIDLPPYPMPLYWQVAPANWQIEEGALQVVATPQSDMFISPAGDPAVLNAARLLGPLTGEFQLSTRVQVEFQGTFDAGALLVWQNASTWAKLCFEYSPDRNPMVVSVVTHGTSDDANGFIVSGNIVWLRVSRLGQAWAFHASTNGKDWLLIRHFGLAIGDTPQVGFVAQSPVGTGCKVRFDQIRFIAERLWDIRNGA
jgi:uncharacterized protein